MCKAGISIFLIFTLGGSLEAFQEEGVLEPLFKTAWSFTPSFCIPHHFYCGHELADMGYNNTVIHALYTCDDDRNGYIVVKCDQNYCKKGDHGSGDGSYCACKPGYAYCGYKLSIGNYDFEHVDDHVLYECDEHAHIWPKEHCVSDCVSPNSGSAFCGDGHWDVNRKYCGYQVGPEHMGEIWSPQHLYKIGPGGTFTVDDHCLNSCIASDKSNSQCEKRNLVATKPKYTVVFGNR